MIEQLHIKCPSCGIILEVKNSRHEAVKRIICPNCKKQLAVDFQENVKPTEKFKSIGLLFHGNKQTVLQEGNNHLPFPDCEHIEINMVRISDGSNKCIVSSLSPNHVVKINGTPLAFGDKVVLAFGDTVETGKTILGYECPVKEINNEPAPLPTEKKVANTVSEPSPKKGHRYWPVAIIVLVVSCLLAIFSRPSNGVTNSNETIEAVTDSSNAVKESKPTPVKDQEKTKQKSSSHQQSKNVKPTDLTDYELERQAMNGDVKAQYELGKRWVNKHDSINIVKGIKYLKMATQNGSSEAQQALNRVSSALEREASHGNTTAENILREQM